MIDRLFSAVLTFALLIGGTCAIGSELLRGAGTPSVRVVQLQRVVVTAKRLEAPAKLAVADRKQVAAASTL